jgi:F0F1-type ATP synthase membrane subunit b/b'
MFVVLLSLITFVVTAIAANSPGPADVHVQDIYGPISFLAAVVVGVLGFLLKWFLTRDRRAVDEKAEAIEKNMIERIDALKGNLDGLGVKVERLAEVVDAKVSEAVEELRRHDRELFQKWDALNREFGQLRGEHDAMKRQHDRSGRPNCSPD